MLRTPRAAALSALLVVGTVLSGCAGTAPPAGPTHSAHGDSTARLQGKAGRAVELLPTVWHVVGATGAKPATYLLFTAGEVEVLEPKGFVLLGWATQGDAMLTEVDGWAESLGTKAPPTVPWLTSAAFFRRVDGGWVLLDTRGERVAELRDDGPAPTSSTTTTTAQPITAFDRRQLADAVAGPGIRTISIGSISGRWSVKGLDPKHALLTVEPSGKWSIQGGCESNTGQDLGGSGSLRLLPRGYLLLTAGAVAGVGCTDPTSTPPPDTAVLTRFAEARSLRVKRGQISLFDRHGKQIGHLTHAR